MVIHLKKIGKFSFLMKIRTIIFDINLTKSISSDGLFSSS